MHHCSQYYSPDKHYGVVLLSGECFLCIFCYKFSLKHWKRGTRSLIFHIPMSLVGDTHLTKNQPVEDITTCCTECMDSTADAFTHS